MTATCVLIDAGPARGLVALPRRRRDALLARLFGSRLDGQLAAGIPPESSRLLAVRAAQITSRAARRRLARHWADLAARARQPQVPFDPRAPISPTRVDAAAEQIESIADVLRADRPLSARGVALATTLLTSSRSPVYRLGGGGAEDLAAAIARAVATM